MYDAYPIGVVAEEDGMIPSVIRATLDSRQLRYQQVDDHVVEFFITNQTGTYPFLVIGHDAINLVRVQASLGTCVPDDRRPAIAEAIARINCRLAVGNFDLDFDDGEVRFRTGIDVGDGLPSASMIENMISFALSALDQYHHALMRVAFADTNPANAIGLM